MSDVATQPCQGLTWTIDPWGNMTAQTTTAGTCNSFSSSVNTKNQLQTGYQYDAAGNVTYDGVHHYTYDAENRIIQVDSGSTATYVYNENGQRVRKSTAPGAFTEFFYGPNRAGAERVQRKRVACGVCICGEPFDRRLHQRHH